MAARTYPDQPPMNMATAAQLSPTAFCYLPGGLSNKPMQIRCPVCREMMTTRVEYVTGLFTWLNCMAFGCISIVCFIIPCFWCCCCYPFYWNTFKDAEHYCTRCKVFVGAYRLI